MDDDLLEEILDDVEALGAQLPGKTVALVCEERARGIAPGAPGRAAWLSSAGERWEMEGDLERAKACYEQAAQDGGDAYLDPRAELVHVLLELGETARVDELLQQLRSDLRAGWSGRFVHETVGEGLELHDRLEEALRWFSAGLTHAQRDDPEAIDLGCLNGRYRVRRALDLPHDRYDELCEQRRREYAADIDNEQRLHTPPRDTGRDARFAVLYWPEKDFRRLVEQWPVLREDYGSDHAEHRSVVEHRLRSLGPEHGEAVVGIGDLDDYLGYVGKRGEKADSAATRAGYAAHLGIQGRFVAWPPGRNDRCWCGSGLKYKRCCGALR